MKVVIVSVWTMIICFWIFVFAYSYGYTSMPMVDQDSKYSDGVIALSTTAWVDGDIIYSSMIKITRKSYSITKEREYRKALVHINNAKKILGELK